MDEIQKTLIAAGREDLAKEYQQKTAAGLEGESKASFDYIDTTIHVATAPVGDRAYKLAFHTYTVNGSTEFMGNYPEEINLGKTKEFRSKVKKEIFDEILDLAQSFDADVQKLMKKYNLIKVKN